MNKAGRSSPDNRAAAVAGALRLAGFMGLILVLTPVHLATMLIPGFDRYAMPQLFHRWLVRLLGFEVRTRGAMSAASATLFVSNHSSYLDVPILGSIIRASFVAKAEVAGWPVIGRLAALQNTVFIERRSSRVAEHRDGMRRRLEAGESLILFPEGTSSDGMRALPFKSSLFSVAENPLPDGRPVTVQPVTILCTELDGLPIGRAWRPCYAWYGDMTFVRHLWRVFCLGHFTVDVIFHPPVTVSAFADRKALALYCHREVAKGVEQCVTGRLRLEPTGSGA
jgi:1-acyl-sn-glycerol-3-phosphate acyltransferase